MKNFHLLLFSITLSTSYAQTYAPENHYLVKNLDLGTLSKGDSILLDTCLRNYHNAKNDTSKIKAINVIVEESWDDNVWPKYNMWVYNFVQNKLADLSDKKNAHPPTLFFLNKTLANALNNIGFIYDDQGDIPLALEYFHKSLKIDEEIGNKQGMSTSYNNIGYIYSNQGDIPLALEYFHKSVKIQEEIKDKKGMAYSYNNIGYIYSNQDDITLALEYFHKSVKIQEEIGNKQGMAISYNNMGTIHSNQNDIPLALEYYHKSAKIREEIKDKKGMAISYNSIGTIHSNQGDISLALEYFYKSLKIQLEIKDKQGVAHSYNKIASIALDQGKLGGSSGALSMATKSLTIAQEIGFVAHVRNASELLSKIYEKQGRFKESLEMYKLFIIMRDSLLSQEVMKASVNQQAKYEYEKEKEIDNVKHQKDIEKHEAIAQEKQEKQQIISWAIGSGLVLVIVFLIFVFNRLRVTRKQKLIIEETNKELNQTNEEIVAQRDQIEYQKVKVEKAHHEVQSSINYAERIQKAILSSKEHWKNISAEHFVLFKPRDVVSRDFYWAYSDKDFVWWVVADCTGHGVPGAFMSMLGVSFLNEIVAERGETNAGQILTKLRAKVVKTLELEGDEECKDGMDIALCVLNKKTNKMQFSGAYNPLFIIRDNSQKEPIGFEKKLQGDTCSLYEYQADRMPIGKFLVEEPFSTTNIQLQKRDSLYTFTDGFQDQFGGPLGKKYMIKRMKNLLLDINSKPSKKQYEILNKEFEEWVHSGDTEQIDDVCLVGVKI